MASKKATTEREVLVLNRYSIRKDFAPKGLHKGDVVLHIRNDKGIEYYTTLRRNKAHSCLCKSVKPCYHIKQMVARENARYAAEKAAKAIETAAQQTVKPVWNDCVARWDDPITGEPTAMLGGVPYWNADKGFLEHPEGKVWDRYNEVWVAPPALTVIDLGLAGHLNRKAFSIL